MTNFRSGDLLLGQPLGMTVQEITLVADNTRIDASNTSLIRLSSDNTTSTNRTFLLNQSTLVGHRLTIQFVSGASTTCEITSTGTAKLTGTWTPTQYDTLTLVSDGTFWVEESRALSGVAMPPTALTSAHIFVGDGSNLAADVAVSGDVTISNTGAVSIGAGKVTKAMLAATVRPAYMVVFAGTFTTLGGDANETIPAVGALNTDLAFVQLRTKGAVARTILTAVTAADEIDVVLSGDPSTDHVICWQILRATT